MIFGIGTDIVCVQRMQDNLDKYGDKFCQRILTASEFEDFQRCTSPAHFLAKRFAAKEAVAKAMGTGFRDGIALAQIGVIHDEFGKPGLEFSDAAKAFIEEQSINEWHISLADEKDHAVAFVTLVNNG